MLNKKAKHIWFIFIFLGFCAGIAAITMLLWNALIPAIFGGIAINYWQAFGLLILARLLFGGFGLHHKAAHIRGHFGKHGDFRHIHNMSRDERREFIRRHMAEHHGFCCNNEENAKKEEYPEQ